MIAKTNAKADQILSTKVAPTEQRPLPWHRAAAAAAALAVHRMLWLVGPPGCGKSTFVRHFSHQHSGMAPFVRQGNPSITDASFWGHKELPRGQTRIVDGRLTEAIKRGGVFVLEDAGAVPIQVLATLLPFAEEDQVLNPNTEEVLTVSPRFRLVLTSNPENLRCRHGHSIFNSLRERCLVLHLEAHSTETIVQILRADFPTLSRGVIESAVSHWERSTCVNDLSGRGDKEDLRLSLRAPKQYLQLIQHGADEGDAVRMAFIDKFCHDKDTHEALRMKWSLASARNGAS